MHSTLSFFVIAPVGRRSYSPPDSEWLPSSMDLSNARSRAKRLPTAANLLFVSVCCLFDDLLVLSFGD